MKKKAKKPKLILASASERRKKLMRKAGYRFRVIPSRASEAYPRNLHPAQIVQYLALKKAKEVARRYPEAVVLGADTLVFVGNRVIGKPRNKNHARFILRRLAGVWQKVLTGVAVACEGGDRCRTGYAVSSVKIRPLSETTLERAVRKHRDKAGAYAIQEKNDRTVEKLRGEYDNVVGLPMRVVKRLLDLAL